MANQQITSLDFDSNRSFGVKCPPHEQAADADIGFVVVSQEISKNSLMNSLRVTERAEPKTVGTIKEESTLNFSNVNETRTGQSSRLAQVIEYS